MVPWAVMSSGSAPSEESVLLDYVGANPLVGTITAIRRRHHNILVCTLGAMAAAVCSIVAASIWDLSSTAYVYRTALQQSATFNGSSLMDSADIAHSVRRYISRTVLQTPTPPWMIEDIVLAPFNFSGPAEGMVLSTITQGYRASLSCNPAIASLSNNGTNITVTYAGVSQMIPCDTFTHQPRNWSYTADPYRT